MQSVVAGFVRLAIEQGAALVPVLALGEIAALRNFFDMPALQQWTYKTIGFPIPYLVVGRWGLTPFPRRTGLRFVVGEPLHPPPLKLGEQVGCSTHKALWHWNSCEPACCVEWSMKSQG